MRYLVSFLFLTTSFLQAQDMAYLTDFQSKWKNAMEYTLEIAEMMPEEHYDFKPTPEIRSFREQLHHVMQNITWLSSSYLGDQPFEKDLKKMDLSKTEIIDLLKEVSAFSQQTVQNLEPHDLRMKVQFFAGPMRLNQILTLLNDHMTHHRGQMILYLRLKGIQPPRYRGW